MPKLLTDANKQAWLDAANEFLHQYRNDPSMLDQIVTDDESWVLYVTPSQKEDMKV